MGVPGGQFGVVGEEFDEFPGGDPPGGGAVRHEEVGGVRAVDLGVDDVGVRAVLAPGGGAVPGGVGGAGRGVHRREVDGGVPGGAQEVAAGRRAAGGGGRCQRAVVERAVGLQVVGGDLVGAGPVAADGVGVGGQGQRLLAPRVVDGVRVQVEHARGVRVRSSGDGAERLVRLDAGPEHQGAAVLVDPVGAGQAQQVGGLPVRVRAAEPVRGPVQGGGQRHEVAQGGAGGGVGGGGEQRADVGRSRCGAALREPGGGGAAQQVEGERARLGEAAVGAPHPLQGARAAQQARVVGVAVDEDVVVDLVAEGLAQRAHQVEGAHGRVGAGEAEEAGAAFQLGPVGFGEELGVGAPAALRVGDQRADVGPVAPGDAGADGGGADLVPHLVGVVLALGHLAQRVGHEAVAAVGGAAGQGAVP
ncbi:hypothetical protein GA0115242_11652 [Streptomyces sp. SolWspMP-5a-2]|nr:hypothetical protein GA0115242_11652 [Streptomyces sp. SolWspMP-5a-2]